jgi:PIN domain nuclease of toxin-antitoxin system
MSQRELPDGPLLLDASFVLAVLDADPDATRFASVLSRSVITAVNFGEVLYKVESVAGLPPDEVASELLATGLGVDPVDTADALRFAELKRVDGATRDIPRGPRGGKRRSLSLADLCCLAHAIEHGLPVLTGDRHWLTVAETGLPLHIIDFRAA